jgi:hypothetical protein
MISTPPAHMTRDLELEALQDAARWPQAAPSTCPFNTLAWQPHLVRSPAPSGARSRQPDWVASSPQAWGPHLR